MTSYRIDPLKVEKVSDLVREWEEDVDLGNHWEPEDWEAVEVTAYREDISHEEGDFFYECQQWHIGKVKPGSYLEQICIESGKDYITVCWEDCPKCQEEEERREREYYEYDMHMIYGPYKR